jgi:serine/threonine protein phosphatase PrpC
MKSYYGTNSGKIRNVNEDNLAIHESENYYLCVVADGMGGHKAGEIASNMAVNTVKTHFISEIQKPDFKVPKFIIECADLANKAIYDKSFSDEEYNGMGTTITMSVIDKVERIAYIGNVGDSRTYLINDDYIKQITDDHTFVQELVKKGEITKAEAKNHSKRNEITRALGAESNINIDIFEIELKDNDKLLLCSDGLTNHITDNDMLYYVKNYGADVVDKLINLANENGGTDNITVIIIDTTDRGEN